ncbi:MAG: hypothetical protein IPK82_40335 [Polyangiaceae bacterium]|nr:hypothetical protein [Polyangiaceae bacterium]
MKCVWFAFALVGCTPAASSTASAPSQVEGSATTSAPSAPSVHTNAGVPTGTGASVGSAESNVALAACEPACVHIEGCVGAPQSWCRADCTGEMVSRGVSVRYMECVKALPCGDIKASLGMNEGPLGRCAKLK